jgi:hypothetical protein
VDVASVSASTDSVVVVDGRDVVQLDKV